jgi:hypothetical protein
MARVESITELEHTASLAAPIRRYRSVTGMPLDDALAAVTRALPPMIVIPPSAGR